MAELVNLNRARKARGKAAAAAKAAANRVRHGRSAAERKVGAIDEARRDARLDGARLETPPKPQR
jgi:hypothetical protein